MDNMNPLVSVFIVTYNSQDYIIDALESVKSQTYHNIELVVSDDCSKDETLAIVRGWIKQNAKRFVRTEIVESSFNTGIPANYNRAVKACQGEWLKMMDGDDMLLNNCISDNIAFVNANPSANVIFSNGYKFLNSNKENPIGELFSDKDKSFFLLDNVGQVKSLLKRNILPSITNFVSAELLQKTPYNEQYRLLEDYPMWLKLSNTGYTFFYFDKYTAMYRITSSVSSSAQYYFPVAYTDCRRCFFYNELLPLIRKFEDNEAYNLNRRSYFIYDMCEILLRNKKNRINSILFLGLKLLNRIVSFKL